MAMFKCKVVGGKEEVIKSTPTPAAKKKAPIKKEGSD